MAEVGESAVAPAPSAPSPPPAAATTDLGVHDGVDGDDAASTARLAEEDADSVEHSLKKTKKRNKVASSAKKKPLKVSVDVRSSAEVIREVARGQGHRERQQGPISEVRDAIMGDDTAKEHPTEAEDAVDMDVDEDDEEEDEEDEEDEEAGSSEPNKSSSTPVSKAPGEDDFSASFVLGRVSGLDGGHVLPRVHPAHDLFERMSRVAVLDDDDDGLEDDAADPAEPAFSINTTLLSSTLTAELRRLGVAHRAMASRMEINSGLFSTYFTKPRRFCECSKLMRRGYLSAYLWLCLSEEERIASFYPAILAGKADWEDEDGAVDENENAMPAVAVLLRAVRAEMAEYGVEAVDLAQAVTLAPVETTAVAVATGAVRAWALTPDAHRRVYARLWHWLRQTKRNRLAILSHRAWVPCSDREEKFRAPDLTALCSGVLDYLNENKVNLGEFCSKIMDVQSSTAHQVLLSPELWSNLSTFSSRAPYINLLRWCALPDEKKLSKLQQQHQQQGSASTVDRRAMLHKLAENSSSSRSNNRGIKKTSLGSAKSIDKKSKPAAASTKKNRYRKEPDDYIPDTPGVAAAFTAELTTRDGVTLEQLSAALRLSLTFLTASLTRPVRWEETSRRQRQVYRFAKAYLGWSRAQKADYFKKHLGTSTLEDQEEDEEEEDEIGSSSSEEEEEEDEEENEDEALAQEEPIDGLDISDRVSKTLKMEKLTMTGLAKALDVSRNILSSLVRTPIMNPHVGSKQHNVYKSLQGWLNMDPKSRAEFTKQTVTSSSQGDDFVAVEKDTSNRQIKSNRATLPQVPLPTAPPTLQCENQQPPAIPLQQQQPHYLLPQKPVVSLLPQQPVQPTFFIQQQKPASNVVMNFPLQDATNQQQGQILTPFKSGFAPQPQSMPPTLTLQSTAPLNIPPVSLPPAPPHLLPQQPKLEIKLEVDESGVAVGGQPKSEQEALRARVSRLTWEKQRLSEVLSQKEARLSVLTARKKTLSEVERELNWQKDSLTLHKPPPDEKVADAAPSSTVPSTSLGLEDMDVSNLNDLAEDDPSLDSTDVSVRVLEHIKAGILNMDVMAVTLRINRNYLSSLLRLPVPTNTHTKIQRLFYRWCHEYLSWSPKEKVEFMERNSGVVVSAKKKGKKRASTEEAAAAAVAAAAAAGGEVNAEAGQADKEGAGPEGGGKRNKTARDGDFLRIPRVKFTPWQSEELQKEFHNNPRPTNKEKAEIARRLGLTLRTVVVFFCNRRQKEAKQLKAKQQQQQQQQQQQETAPPATVGASDHLAMPATQSKHDNVKVEGEATV